MEQFEAAEAIFAVDVARDDEDFAALFEGEAGSDEGAGFAWGFDNKCDEGQTTDDAVAGGEILGKGWRVGGIFG